MISYTPISVLFGLVLFPLSHRLGSSTKSRSIHHGFLGTERRKRARCAQKVAAAPSEFKCHPVSRRYAPHPNQRPHVRLRGWKAQTGDVQGSEPCQQDVSWGARTLKGTLLSTRHSSCTHRRSGKLKETTDLRAVKVPVVLQWEFQTSGSGYRIKKVCPLAFCETRNSEHTWGRSTTECQINSATRQEGPRTSDSRV